MLLAVDVGNTQTHVGLFREEELLEHWRFHTARTATADELAVVFSSILGLAKLELADVQALMVSCVVPALSQEYDQLLARYLDGRGALVGPQMATGMPIRINDPRELGADRLANAVAAYERFGAPCIAVDFGTAVNYDVVSGDGEYVGGVIAPGVEISLEALSQRAAALPRIRLAAPPSPIGRSTLEAIQSGVVYGYAGQVDGLVGRLREAMGEADAIAIATGGFAGVIAPHCDQIDEVDDLLTLQGLRIIWERNSPSGP
ncbi:MAG: type III pantothenate kinase [Thermoleophilaceae bacterium]